MSKIRPLFLSSVCLHRKPIAGTHFLCILLHVSLPRPEPPKLPHYLFPSLPQYYGQGTRRSTCKGSWHEWSSCRISETLNICYFSADDGKISDQLDLISCMFEYNIVRDNVTKCNHKFNVSQKGPKSIGNRVTDRVAYNMCMEQQLCNIILVDLHQ